MPSNSSFAARYSAKLAGNFFALLSSVVVMSLVPRSLGAQAFGNFDFITTTFTVYLGSLALNYPYAFVAWISRYKKEVPQGAVTAAFGKALLLFTGLLIFCALAFALQLQGWFWPAITPDLIWLGAGYAGLFFFSEFLTAFIDGIRQSVGLEVRRILVNFCRVGLVAALFFGGGLTIHTYFYVCLFTYAFLVAIQLGVLRGAGAVQFKQLFAPQNRAATREYLQYFWTYSKPFIWVNILTFLYQYADRWVLQFFGGSAEQGAFAFANRLSTATFLFTSSIIPIVFREIAQSAHDQNLELQRRHFSSLQLLLAMTGCLSAFVAIFSRELTALLAGSEFTRNLWPVALMAFYPFHQTVNQFCAIFFQATGRTGLYARLSFVNMSLSLALSILVFSSPWFVTGWEATCVAAKILLLQAIGAHCQIFFVFRLLQQKVWPFIWSQILIIGSSLGIAWFFHQAISRWIHGPVEIFGWTLRADIISVSLGLVTTFATFGALAILKPALLGIPPYHVQRLRTFVRELLAQRSRKI